MKGKEFFAELEKKFKMKTDRALNGLLGHKNISQYQNRNLTAKTIVGFVDGACKSARKNSIRIIVEFFPVQKCDSAQGKKWELFDMHDDNGKEIPYFSGLYNELVSAKVGVYVFFDSRGKAVYVGMTTKGLWREMKNAFNRERDVQSLYRVKHPTNRKVAYKNSQEKTRHISSHNVPLHELAHYFSAYEVHPDIVGTVEALLIHTSPNDILNARMENI